jgi:hypothetical protein
MKIIPLVLLFLIAQMSYGQNQFTHFIKKSSIQYAAYATDTFHFNNPNLSLLLREKFSQGKIKAGLVQDAPDFDITTPLPTETILNRIAPNRVNQIIDEAGNVTATTIEAEHPFFSSKYFDAQTNDLVEVQQILYIQSGKLKSYIPWVSPKYVVSTSWGQKLGIANAFSTGFKNSRCVSTSIKKKAVFLGNTVTMIPLDTALQPKMLKQLYELNLLQALWPYLNNKKYEIYRVDSGTLISFSKINFTLMNHQPLNIPIYDEEGNPVNKKIPQDEPLLNASTFTSVALVQDWFYHAEKNKLFNNISHLILYAPKIKNGQQDSIASPLLKIRLK